MTMEQPSAACPYCGSILNKPPQRKAKCPFCGNFMYVRTLPTTRQRVVVTESRAKEIEDEWTAIINKKKWLKRLGCYSVSEMDYEHEKNQLSTTFGQEAKDRDVVWSLFNRLIVTKPDFQTLKTVYYDMALFLEEENRDFRTCLEQYHKMELLSYKQLGVVKVAILSAGAGNSCEACYVQHGKVYTIEEALRLMPIPCKDCTHTLSGERKGFCRCLYTAVI